jgi:oligoribonuclease
VEEYLHYRSVDVSTVKELARRWYPEAYTKAPK